MLLQPVRGQGGPPQMLVWVVSCHATTSVAPLLLPELPPPSLTPIGSLPQPQV
jgi:hypothetical protein